MVSAQFCLLQVTNSIATWGDCSLLCEQAASCNHWQLEESSQQCTTMASYDYDVAEAGWVSGNSYCTSLSEYIGWVTCSETNPNTNLAAGDKETVRTRFAVPRFSSDHSLSSSPSQPG